MYLGSNIASTDKDVLMRISKAWSALDLLRTIWKSTLPEKINKAFFRAVVESVLLYGSSAWTITKKQTNLMEYTHACYVQS